MRTIPLIRPADDDLSHDRSSFASPQARPITTTRPSGQLPQSTALLRAALASHRPLELAGVSPVRLAGETVFQSVLRRLEALGIFAGADARASKAQVATPEQLSMLEAECDRHGVEMRRLTLQLSYVAVGPEKISANFSLWLADALSALPVCAEVPGDRAAAETERHLREIVNIANRIDAPQAIGLVRPLKVSKGAAEPIVTNAELGLSDDVNPDLFRAAVDLRVRLYLSGGSDVEARAAYLSLVYSAEFDQDAEMWIDRAAAERLALLVREADVAADRAAEARETFAEKTADLLARAKADGCSDRMVDGLRELMERATGTVAR